MTSTTSVIAASKVDWGDVPTWIASAASVAGLIGLVITAILANKIYKIESKRDRETAAERTARDVEARRAQANRVAAWFGVNPDGTMAYNEFGARIRNASDLAVYEVSARFSRVADPSVSFDSGGSLPAVPPGDTVYLGMEASSRTFLDTLAREARPGTFGITLIFRDAAGLRWQRDTSGELTELP
jgi:hypothetical protein